MRVCCGSVDLSNVVLHEHDRYHEQQRLQTDRDLRHRQECGLLGEIEEPDAADPFLFLTEQGLDQVGTDMEPRLSPIFPPPLAPVSAIIISPVHVKSYPMVTPPGIVIEQGI